MRIASFNVNGIRAAVRRGFGDWLQNRAPDVVAIQEMRCSVADLPVDASGQHHLTYAPGTQSGRNGVALLTRQAPAAIRTWGSDLVTLSPGELTPTEVDVVAGNLRPATIARGLSARMGGVPFTEQGRYLEVDLADAPLTVASLYLPKGGTPFEDEASLAKYERKMRFLKAFATQLDQSRKAALARGNQFLVMGDFNVANTRLDVANWRGNAKSEGFLPEEREWFTAQLGRKLTDVVRSKHPDQAGPYSWWSWRGQAFVNDTGWRIDYHLATPALARTATAAGSDRDASYEARISDHCPVVVDYDLSSMV